MQDEFYFELLDNLFDGVYYVDRRRRITFWNKAAERLTGYEREEVLGSSCSNNILKHIDAEGHELCKEGCPLHATIRDGQMREDILYLHHKQGHRVPVHVRISPLFNTDGKIVGGIEVFSDGSQSLQTLRELEHLRQEAYLDPLLQIGNRRYADMIFKTRLYELNSFGVSCGVIFVDIDDFKRINDVYGHPIGDNILRMVSNSIAGALRQMDSLTRWGGDEMLIFLPNVTRQGLQGVAERIRVLVERSFIVLDQKEIAVTVSLGVTFLDREDTLDSLIKRLDSLLYRSKQEGRNRITFR